MTKDKSKEKGPKMTSDEVRKSLEPLANNAPRVPTTAETKDNPSGSRHSKS